jgi:subtilisin family serine protease
MWKGRRVRAKGLPIGNVNSEWGGAVWILVLAMAASGRQTDGRSYVRRGEDWFLQERGREWRVDRELITVRFKASIADLDALRVAARGAPDAVRDLIRGLRLLRANRLGFRDLLLPTGSDPLEARDRLRASGLFELVEENTVGHYDATPNDAFYPTQWALNNTGQTGGLPDADIDCDLAWDLSTGDPSIVIAVADSGVEVTHFDLVSNAWHNPGEIAGNGLDDDQNGFVDDVFGWDFANNDADVTGPASHGTEVTGVASARTNNFNGIAGVAGGFANPNLDGCRFMTLGVGDFNPSNAFLDDAIVYAADNGASIINMSLGVPQSAAVDAAIDYAYDQRGLFLCAASGNSGALAQIEYPASHPSVVSVPATTHLDTRLSASTSGPENWVAAPGTSVHTTTTNGQTKSSSGTSFASPHVAGVAGLMRSQLPTLRNDSIRDILRDTADDIGPPGFDEGTGWGRLNAFAAVSHVAASDCNGNGVYDPDDIAAGTSKDANLNGVPDECEVLAFCSAKSGQTCGPATIDSSGASSAGATSGFTIRAFRTLGARGGAWAYTDAGPQITPFQGGFLCLPGSARRLSHRISSGGSPGACDGIFVLDVNAFAAGQLGGSPAAFLSTPGTQVHCQWIGRDSPATGAFLSAGLQYTVGP